MASGTMPAGGPSPAIVFELLTSYMRTSALCAAIDLGYFRALGEGPADARTLARRLGATERGARILSDYLVVLGLVRKEGGLYRHSETSAAFLDPNSPRCVAAAAKCIAHPENRRAFDRLAEIIRDDGGAASGDREGQPWLEFAFRMAPMMAPAAAPLGRIVLAGRGGPMEVLDVAAGSGVFGIEVAKQNPQARVTALDRAAALEGATANARKQGVASQYHTLEGSPLEAEFGGPYDVVLLTNLLHHLSPESCVGLLKKARSALKKGGCAATLDFVPNEDRVSPPIPAALSMMMLATTERGDAYTFSDLSRMYREAGLERVERHPVPLSPHTVVTGTKG